MSAITANRKQRLRTLKKQIREGYEVFFTTGMALTEIRENNLFLEDGYETFESFVKSEFDMNRAHAYRLMDAAKTRKSLPAPPVSPNGDTRTDEWTEWTIRPLTKLDPKVAERVSKKAVAKVEKSHKQAEKDPEIKPLRLTARLIEETIREDQHKVPKKKSRPKEKVYDLDEEVRRIADAIDGHALFLGNIPEEFWREFVKGRSPSWKRLRAAIGALDGITK